MVERTNTIRRAQRAVSALPYKRPTSKRANEPKKSGFFGTISNLFSSFWRNEEELPIYASRNEAEVETADIAAEPSSAANALVERGNCMQDAQTAAPQFPVNNMFQAPPPPPPPQQPPAPSPPPVLAMVAPPRSQLSPPTDRQRELDYVTEYMQQRSATGLNPVELAGVLSILKQAPEPVEEPRVPFRFTTVARDPVLGPSTEIAKSAPRMLTKNPNGTMVWRGGGSSKPRSRYTSPGFPPTRTAPMRMKLSPAKQKADGKRRKIEEERDEPVSKAGTSPAIRTNGTTSETNGHISISASAKASTSASASRQNERSPSPQKLNSASSLPVQAVKVRTTGLQLSTPAVPSPLRQMLAQADPPSPPPPTAPAKPTHAANFMAELVKDTAPKEPPVFTNPYQAAYPAPLPARSNRKLSSTRKRTKTAEDSKTADENAKAKVELPTERRPEAELSPQKIIEATLPKGAKRSRPPPDLGKQREQSSDSGLRKSARLKSPESMSDGSLSQAVPANDKALVLVEDVSDEDNEPSPKKSKPNGVARPLQPAAEIAERSAPDIVELADKEISTQSAQSKPSHDVVLPAQIVEPGQKEESRTPTVTSYNPFAVTVPGPKSALGVKSSAPKAPSKLRYSIQAEKDDSPKQSGKELPSLGLGFPSSRPSVPVHSAPTPASALTSTPATIPTFATPTTPTPTPTTSVSTIKESKPKTTVEIKAFVVTLPENELPKYTFDIPLSSPGAGPSIEKAKAAAMAVPLSALPMFDFAAPALSAVTTSENIPTSSALAATSAGFNWAAAGMKQPSKPADNWDCSVCGLSNPPAASSKCQVCEAPKSGAESATPTFPAAIPTSSPASVSGFNWSAAGMKMPPKPADNWDCLVCGLSNPPVATSKCQVCEAPKPAATSVTPAPPAATPTPPPAPVSGFNWAAAGMKLPTAPTGWKCSTCMLDNPDSVTKCTVCESPR